MVHSYIVKKSGTQNVSQIISALKDHFPIIQDSREQGNYFYYDTFDWRLYKKGYHLYLTDQHLSLFNFKRNYIEIEEDLVTSVSKTLMLPAGSIQKQLIPLLDVRALILVATFKKISYSFRILNKDKKTIAYLKINQNKIKDGNRFIALDPCLEIRPLRGYTQSVSTIRKKISFYDLKVYHNDLIRMGLQVLGRIPADYSSKINIPLKPQLPAGQALRKIYRYLLQIMKKNENGIINDIDIEFLHDFRVSARRTRSALGQTQNILDEDIVQKATKDFNYLGQSTNRLRDIDVYLLKEDQYKEMLSENRRDYLNPFFEDLKHQRKIENALVIKILKSVRYKRIINEWEFYLNARINAKNLTATEKKPIIIVARKVICERNQKVLEFGKNIVITSSDELLHQLRIAGKKLRYLLEFFNSLFPQTEMQILIKKLKQLQDNLGDYHDLAVHQEMLKKFEEQLTIKESGEKETILTLGILIRKLNEKQELVKKDFFETFRIYSAPEIQKIFHDLFYDSML